MCVRPVVVGVDDSGLLEVFAAVRGPELALSGIDAAQLSGLLRMQLELQQRAYVARYPDAMHGIVEVDGVIGGQLRVARGADEIVLIDIALLPSFQGQGLGTRLISELIEEATRAGVPLRLCVRPDNRARGLYRRLGFQEVAQTPTQIDMSWRASGTWASAGASAARRDSRAPSARTGEKGRGS